MVLGVHGGGDLSVVAVLVVHGVGDWFPGGVSAISNGG